MPRKIKHLKSGIHSCCLFLPLKKSYWQENFLELGFLCFCVLSYLTKEHSRPEGVADIQPGQPDSYPTWEQQSSPTAGDLPLQAQGLMATGNWCWYTLSASDINCQHLLLGFESFARKFDIHCLIWHSLQLKIPFLHCDIYCKNRTLIATLQTKPSTILTVDSCFSFFFEPWLFQSPKSVYPPTKSVKRSVPQILQPKEPTQNLFQRNFESPPPLRNLGNNFRNFWI